MQPIRFPSIFHHYRNVHFNFPQLFPPFFPFKIHTHNMVMDTLTSLSLNHPRMHVNICFNKMCTSNVYCLQNGCGQHNTQIPFMISSLQNTTFDWGYSIQKTHKSGNLLAQNVTWPSGKFIGGSAGMNLRFYVRGNPRDFNEWEYAGNPNWNWQNMQQYFMKAENYQTEALPPNQSVVDDELHGKMGPLPINSFVNEHSFKKTLFDAAQELGHKQIADLNGNEFIGIGQAPGIISQGKLFNAAKAYLSPSRNRTNLHVIKNAHVHKVNVDNTTGQVTGVQFQINQTQQLTAHATKETILSAGSIGTPKILQLSGIGPEKYLTRLNISVIRNLHTGFSLQNHITVPLFIQFNVSDVKTIDINTDAIANVTANANLPTHTDPGNVDSTDTLYNYIKQRKDISELQNVFDVLGFFSTSNSQYPNIGTQYAIFKNGDTILLTEYLKVKIGLNETVAQPIIAANTNADIVIVFVTLLNPMTLGKVHLSSSDPYALPIIQSNYLNRPEDVTVLVQGIQLARKFMETTPFQQLNATDIVLSIPECETVSVKKTKIKPTKAPKEKSKKNDKKNKGRTTTTTTTEVPPIEEPLPEPIPYGSNQYFECYVKQVAKTYYEPVGTSKMGNSIDRFAVVDSRLKVHHLTGLRVVDASIMPKIVSAPIDAATIAIAEKASDIIKDDWATIDAATKAGQSSEASATTETHEEL